MRRLTEAEAALRAALELRRAFYDEQPTSWRNRQELALTCRTWGWLMQCSGRLPQAEEAFREALDLQQKLVADSPNHPESCRNLALGHAVLAHLLLEMGRAGKAEQSFRAAERLHRRAVEKVPADPQATHDLAWLLVTAPVPLLHDAGEAVALATKAADLRPAGAWHWLTLGVAHYRAGDWQAARAPLEKCLSQPGDVAVMAGFVLAMTDWQLGTKDRACHRFDKASALFAADHVAQAGRFRREAAALLGIHEPALPAPGQAR